MSDSNLTPLDGGAGLNERVSSKWLVFVGLFGTALVVAYSIVQTDPLGGLLLELGVGMLLFSVLFWFERRFIRRLVDEAIVSLTARTSEDDPILNEQTPGDFHGDFGPLFMAQAFVGCLRSGEFDKAFQLMTAQLRLALVQSWLFKNRESLGLELGSELDAQADHLMRGPHEDEPRWNEFSAAEGRALANTLRQFPEDRLGWSQRRRILGPRHELMIAFNLPPGSPNGIIVTEPRQVENALKLVLEAAELESVLTYGVAAFQSECPPVPGWPPTFWNIYDEVAEAAHVGVQSEPFFAESDEE